MGTLIGILFFVFHGFCVYRFLGFIGLGVWFVSYWTFGIWRNWDAIQEKIKEIKERNQRY